MKSLIPLRLFSLSINSFSDDDKGAKLELIIDGCWNRVITESYRLPNLYEK
jgi:hypothetical protein